MRYQALSVAGLVVLLCVVGLCGCPCPFQVRISTVVEPAEAGTVTRAPARDTYARGVDVTLTAQPASGWRFQCWEGPVDDPELPVTNLQVRSAAEITARFVQASSGGQITVALPLDEEGAAMADTTVAIPGGSRLLIPATTKILLSEGGPLQGAHQVFLQDEPAGHLESVAWTTWAWAFQVRIPSIESEEIPQFTSVNNENIVQPERVPAGLTISIPICEASVAPNKMAMLYREISDSDPAQKSLGGWEPIESGLVDDAGVLTFEVPAAGRYAIGLPPPSRTGLPGTPVRPEYDCTLDSASVITMASACESSTAIVLGAWIFRSFSPGAIPEISDWYVQDTPDGPIFARIENYGKRMRIRSPYANRFFATCGTVSGPYRERMEGPFEVDASGQPAPEALENPYEQCGREFDAPMKLRIIARQGNRTSFRTEVLQPLELAYDTPGKPLVKESFFRRLREGYVAEIWVSTHECARQVGLATSMAHEQEVNLYVRGRLAILVDRRGGGPYVAVSAPVANATAPGIQFIDPFWILVGGVIWEFYLGGPVNPIFGDVDLEYSDQSDTLWVLCRGADGIRGVYRYDHPITNGGDRPPDYTLPLAGDSLLDIYLDQAQDRLFVRDMDLNNPYLLSETVHVYDQASSAGPVARSAMTHMTGLAPDHPEQADPIYVESLASRGDEVFVFRQVIGSLPEGYGQAGQEVARFGLATVDGAAQYRGWAAFGPPGAGPTLPGTYDPMTDLLFVPTCASHSGKNALFVIENPTAWQSNWVTPNDDMPYWEPVVPVWREIQWPNSGTVEDLDVLEDDPEENPTLLALVQTRDNPNESQIHIIDEANAVSGMVTPAYSIVLHNYTTTIEFVNPPAPEE